LHLYQGTTRQFIADARLARLANQLSDRIFDEFRYRPAPSEVTAWRNSLGSMATVLQLADLTDLGILVELKLPLSSKRLDVLITGSNPTTRRDHAVMEAVTDEPFLSAVRDANHVRRRPVLRPMWDRTLRCSEAGDARPAPRRGAPACLVSDRT